MPVGNSWRTTGDIGDNWRSMIGNIDTVRLYYFLQIPSKIFVFRTTNMLIIQALVVGMIQIVSRYSYYLMKLNQLIFI
jgi:hypothetical protein